MAANIFQVGIERQRAAEILEGGKRLIELQIAMGHADRRPEMISVQLQRLMTVVGGVFEPLEGELRDRPLVPSLRKAGRLVDQLARPADRIGKLTVLIEAA